MEILNGFSRYPGRSVRTYPVKIVEMFHGRELNIELNKNVGLYLRDSVVRFPVNSATTILHDLTKS